MSHFDKTAEEVYDHNQQAAERNLTLPEKQKPG